MDPKVVNVYEVYTPQGEKKIVCKEVESVKVPAVFSAPLRHDVVMHVHDLMRKNSRQANGVKRNAGHEYSAESWGTGRAVARIPRVRGGGTSKSGQAAFGNMCKGGHMFAPKKTWRKIHFKVNKKQCRLAMLASIAATGSMNLVLNRGHLISQTPECPLVISDTYESINKTKEAKKVLLGMGLYDDCMKAKDSKTMRAGKGKMRNRRFKSKRGPLVVYKNNHGITNAFRNIPGITLLNVNCLNVLKLAPGGLIGRMTVWTKSAFQELDNIYAANTIPKPMIGDVSVTDFTQSASVLAALKDRNMKAQLKAPKVKKNPLKNAGAMHKLNPYAAVLKRQNKRKLEMTTTVPAKAAKA